MSIEKIIFVFGLTLDILGAFWLAKSFIVKNLQDLTFEGTSGYGSPPNLRYIKSNLLQKSEAQIGFSFLAMGFILQSHDYFFLSSFSNFTIQGIVVGSILVILAFVINWIAKHVQKLLFNYYGKRMAAIVIRRTPPEGERDDDWIITVAEYLIPMIQKNPDEDNHSFADRVLDKLNITYN